MLTLFRKAATEKSKGAPTTRIIPEHSGVERFCLGKHEDALLGEIQGTGITTNNELEESYIEIARGKYQK